ncbi:MAG: hypothetical protein ACREE7_17195, partial [Dongiaceae bacterium]
MVEFDQRRTSRRAIGGDMHPVPGTGFKRHVAGESSAVDIRNSTVKGEEAMTTNFDGGGNDTLDGAGIVDGGPDLMPVRIGAAAPALLDAGDVLDVGPGALGVIEVGIPNDGAAPIGGDAVPP